MLILHFESTIQKGNTKCEVDDFQIQSSKFSESFLLRLILAFFITILP